MKPTYSTPPTADVSELFDPLERKPPTGVQLLVVTRGGVLVKAPWASDCIAWGYLPRIPESVKQRQRELLESTRIKD